MPLCDDLCPVCAPDPEEKVGRSYPDTPPVLTAEDIGDDPLGRPFVGVKGFAYWETVQVPNVYKHRDGDPPPPLEPAFLPTYSKPPKLVVFDPEKRQFRTLVIEGNLAIATGLVADPKARLDGLALSSNAIRGYEDAVLWLSSWRGNVLFREGVAARGLQPSVIGPPGARRSYRVLYVGRPSSAFASYLSGHPKEEARVVLMDGKGRSLHLDWNALDNATYERMKGLVSENGCGLVGATLELERSSDAGERQAGRRGVHLERVDRFM